MPSNWTQSDTERREVVNRAINIAGAGTVLMQVFINRLVQQLSNRELGLQAILDRRPGTGNAAYINRRTPGTTGGEWVADTTAATEETGTHAQATFTYRTLLTRGRVTRKMRATGRSYGDVLGMELAAKAEDFANALENGCVVGDTAANANQMNGLLTLVNAVSGQVIANTSSTSGDALVLAKLDETIDQVKGSSDSGSMAIVGSKAGTRQLNGALQAQQQFNDVREIAAGFRVRTYDGIPIIKSTEMPDTLVTDAAGNIATFTAGSVTALAVVSLRHVWLEELTPQTVMPLDNFSSQYDEFDIYWDGALVLANTLGAALLSNINPSA